MEYYESDEDIQKCNIHKSNINQLNNNHLSTEYNIWKKSLFEIEENFSEKYLLSYEDITCCKVIFVEMGEILGELELYINDTKLYYPNAPPLLKWNSSNLKVNEYLNICHMEMVRKENWNLCYTILDILDNIYDYIITLKLLSRKLEYNNDLFHYLIHLSKSTNIFLNSMIHSNLPKLGIIQEKTKNETEKQTNGYGYSQGDTQRWNTTKWKDKQKELFIHLSNIYQLILNDLTFTDIENIKTSCLKSFMIYYISNGSIQDYEINKENYIIIYKIVKWWYLSIGFDKDLHLSTYIFYQEIKQVIDISKEKDELIEYIDINHVQKYMNQVEEHEHMDKEYDTEKLYIKQLKPYQFAMNEDYKIHTYLKDKCITTIPSNKWLKRLMIEWKDLYKSLPLHPDGSIFINWSSEGDMTQYYKILIIPSLTTPYGGGCYLFDMYIPIDYPNIPPKLNFMTTGYGSVRFNPNLYNCGKVCLSLLGTWSGEKWDSSVSNIYQVLVSILGLIFVEEPYYNEPGYQNLKETTQGDKYSFDYNTQIRLSNIKYGIIDMIKTPPEEFKEIIRLHYQLRKKEIIENINKWINEYNTFPKIQNEFKRLLLELHEII